MCFFTLDTTLFCLIISIKPYIACLLFYATNVVVQFEANKLKCHYVASICLNPYTDIVIAKSFQKIRNYL